eukprot:TRINITY_DN106172_c0_g1_i1.p1 TRINITY_DN106172_c0_g1~~TRINITY_DN106172_c0_g1_i1.p1  ORF type:complete len:457 (+),score=77.15 TRINITY_DN106172_c0_g1_i1:58-1428(+)
MHANWNNSPRYSSSAMQIDPNEESDNPAALRLPISLSSAKLTASRGSSASTTADFRMAHADREGSSTEPQHTSRASSNSTADFTPVQAERDGGDTPASSDSIGVGSGDYEERLKRWNERRSDLLRKREKRAQLGFGTTNRTPFLTGPQAADVSTRGLPIEPGSAQRIGSGSFAHVYKAELLDDYLGLSAGEHVTIKVIKYEESRPRNAGERGMRPPKFFSRERSISTSLNHPNLLHVLETFVDRLPYVLVAEYCAGGSLHDLVKGDFQGTLNVLGWNQRSKVALDIARGMAHLHAQDIVHRDLKPSNVLLKERIFSPGDEVHAKVCDFGLARYVKEEKDPAVLSRMVGTWVYTAPEILSNEPYDEKCDVYSFGILLYELLSGKSPKPEGMDGARFVLSVCSGIHPDEGCIPEDAPMHLRSIMRDSWQLSSESRPSFEDIAVLLLSAERPSEARGYL